jgi:hypothetical protein
LAAAAPAISFDCAATEFDARELRPVHSSTRSASAGPFEGTVSACHRHAGAGNVQFRMCNVQSLTVPSKKRP